MQARGALLLSAYPGEFYTNMRIYGGVFLFLFGMTANIHSDHILRNLRKPGETGYKIPQGDSTSLNKQKKWN